MQKILCLSNEYSEIFACLTHLDSKCTKIKGKSPQPLVRYFVFIIAYIKMIPQRIWKVVWWLRPQRYLVMIREAQLEIVSKQGQLFWKSLLFEHMVCFIALFIWSEIVKPGNNSFLHCQPHPVILGKAWPHSSARRFSVYFIGLFLNYSL